MFSNHANLRPRDHYEKAGNFSLVAQGVAASAQLDRAPKGNSGNPIRETLFDEG